MSGNSANGPCDTSWDKKNPERRAALTRVANALRSGRLVKGHCRQCGSHDRVRAQHENYAKPLEIYWLCLKCHTDKVTAEHRAQASITPKRKCGLDECERVYFSTGYCNLHYDRFSRHGDPRHVDVVMRPRGEADDWLNQHKNHDSDECLTWPFRRHPDGRAHMSKGWAARLMCELVNGPAPTPKHQAAHSCGKGHEACVNPKHLRWATPVENAADKEIHGTIVVGSRHYTSKLSDADVLSIRQRAKCERQIDIAQEYGVSITCINKIVHRRTWRHL